MFSALSNLDLRTSLREASEKVQAWFASLVESTLSTAQKVLRELQTSFLHGLEQTSLRIGLELLDEFIDSQQGSTESHAIRRRLGTPAVGQQCEIEKSRRA